MKNIVILVVSFLFLFTFVYYNNRPFFSNSFSDYTATLKTASSEGLFIKSGDLFFNKKGESYVFDGNLFSEEDFIKYFGAEVVKREVLPQTEIIYAYSNKIKVYKVLFNSKVNVHIAVSNGKIKVGIPFIFDGF